MASLTPSNQPRRHVLGDLVARHYTVSGTNGDTLIVPQGDILHVSITPTTAVAVGATISGSVITFVSGGAFAADVMVFSRIG